MHQTRESLDAQTSEQQEGKREAWINTGFGSWICALGNSENTIPLNKSGGGEKKKKKRVKKRDLRKPEWGFRQEQAPNAEFSNNSTSPRKNSSRV